MTVLLPVKPETTNKPSEPGSTDISVEVHTGHEGYTIVTTNDQHNKTEVHKETETGTSNNIIGIALGVTGGVLVLIVIVVSKFRELALFLFGLDVARCNFGIHLPYS